jgi:hypothetical protein
MPPVQADPQCKRVSHNTQLSPHSGPSRCSKAVRAGPCQRPTVMLLLCVRVLWWALRRRRDCYSFGCVWEPECSCLTSAVVHIS